MFQLLDRNNRKKKNKNRKRGRRTALTTTASSTWTSAAAANNTASARALLLSRRSSTGGGSGNTTSNNNNNNTNIINNEEERIASILKDTDVVCLSGFSMEQKEYYHSLITKMGGKYTRAFDPWGDDKNTHLIALSPKGEKYEVAVQQQQQAAASASSEEGSTGCHIVKPSWLECCYQARQRVDEKLHSFTSPPDEEDDYPSGSSNSNLSNINRRNNAAKKRKRKNSPPAAQQKLDFSMEERGEVDDPNKPKRPPLHVELRDCLSNTTSTWEDGGDGDDDNKNGANNIIMRNTTDQQLVLFSSCNFFMVGFDNDNTSTSGGGGENKNMNNGGGETATTTTTNLKLLLGKLIRRGLGTIFWNFNLLNSHPDDDYDDIGEGSLITHVIVNDGASKAIRDAARTISLQYANNQYGSGGGDGPMFVSPRWVIDSWTSKHLCEEQQYPPIYQMDEVKKPTQKQVDDKKKKKPKTEEKVASLKKKETTQLFKGSVFAVIRVSPPPWAVDYDIDTIEKSIKANGGQLLSNKIIEALKYDSKNNNSGGSVGMLLSQESDNTTAKTNKRKCFIVGWGGYTSSHLDIHPLLSQVKRHSLCDLQQVSPIWLRTCVTEQKVISPSQLPALFSSSSSSSSSSSTTSSNVICHSRPIYSLSATTEGDVTKPKKKKKSKKKLAPDSGDGIDKANSAVAAGPTQPSPTTVRISVTGFSGYKRTAVIHMIKAMGAVYDDSMRTCTTHLICRSAGGGATGQKYEKAKQWGSVKIITVDWLYHVAQYGYNGKQQPQQQQSGATTTTSGGGGEKGKDNRHPSTATTSSFGCEARFPVC